jgi:hypothetical protein
MKSNEKQWIVVNGEGGVGMGVLFICNRRGAGYRTLCSSHSNTLVPLHK